jgi:hypothetical protein
MLIEKYIIVGIEYSTDIIKDITKAAVYNSIIDNISIVKQKHHNIFVDEFAGPFTYKSDALKRLENIRNNFYNVVYWSIYPVIVDVTLQELRMIKLKKLKKYATRKNLYK